MTIIVRTDTVTSTPWVYSRDYIDSHVTIIVRTDTVPSTPWVYLRDYIDSHVTIIVKTDTVTSTLEGCSISIMNMVRQVVSTVFFKEERFCVYSYVCNSSIGQLYMVIQTSEQGQY